MLCVLRSGHAQVMLEGGDTKYMKHLRMGDRVQTVDAQGNLRFDDVFVFGEKDAQTMAPYVQLTLKASQDDRQAPCCNNPKRKGQRIVVYLGPDIMVPYLCTSSPIKSVRAYTLHLWEPLSPEAAAAHFVQPVYNIPIYIHAQQMQHIKFLLVAQRLCMHILSACFPAIMSP